LYHRDIAARTEPTILPPQTAILLQGFPETGDTVAAAVLINFLGAANAVP